MNRLVQILLVSVIALAVGCGGDVGKADKFLSEGNRNWR